MPPAAIARRVRRAISRAGAAVAVRRMPAGAGEQELDDRGLGELGRRAEAAVAFVEGLLQARHGSVEDGGVERLGRGREQRAAGEPGADPLAAGADLLGLLAPGLGDRLQHLRPRRHPVAGLGGEVGAAVERQLLGGEEDVQRPAPVAGHALHGLHVERVDVGALLAVDLDADELLVHQRRSARVLEGLALHHVAPVAGGVADRDEQRHIALAGARQRGRPPGQPVDGIVGVLAQVGRGLECERVGHRSPGLSASARALAAESGSQWDRRSVSDQAAGVTPARESLALAMLTSKRVPPRSPVARWPEAITTVPREAAPPPIAHGDAADPAPARGEGAAELDARHEREAAQAHGGGAQPGVATVQAAEAGPAGQFLLGLEGRPDHLALEVHEGVEHGGQRPAGVAAQARDRLYVGEPRRGDRGGTEDVGRRLAGLDWLPARPAREEGGHGSAGTAAEVAADHGVPGVGDDEHLRIRYQRGDAPRVGGGGAQVLGAGEDQGAARPAAGPRGAGRGRRPASPGTVGMRLSSQVVAAVEGVEVRARQGVQRGQRFGAARGGRRGALPEEGPLLAGGGQEEGVVFFFAGFQFGLGASAWAAARWGSGPRRAASAAAAGRGRGAVRIGRPRAAARAGRGSGRRPA